MNEENNSETEKINKEKPQITRVNKNIICK